MPIETDAILEVLAELVAARGPCGHEDEVDAVCRRHLEPFCDEVTTDPAGNVVGLIRGQSREPGVKVMAHKDELGAYVKRIEDDGRLSVRPRGFLYRRFGDGPVDVLPDSGEPIPGVIGLGPRHASENPGEPRDGKEVSWEAVRVNTRLSRDELRVRGVHAGSRVVVGRSRRRLFFFEDCVGSYFLDDRAGIALMLAAGAEVRRGGPPPCDVHFICSSLEEIAGGAAAYASHSLPGEILLALDVAPAHPSMTSHSTRCPSSSSATSSRSTPVRSAGPWPRPARRPGQDHATRPSSITARMRPVCGRRAARRRSAAWACRRTTRTGSRCVCGRA